jgi:hypothetical protein
MKKRVRIPVRDVKSLLDLANKVREKHLADGDASPLKVLNWDQINTAIDDAITIEDKALKMKRDKLKFYQQRSRRIEAVVNIMRSTRDVLTGVHPDEMKALGAWGFDVFDNRISPPAEEEQTPEKV